ncbi:MAG TPA: hypothetical protein VJ998_07445, partial [Pseudomonadales bacterium]|nr:hypothetical protein [Pseudomonadales bacterium]
LTCLVLLFVELTHSSTPSGAVAFEVGLGAGFKLLLATLTVFALVNLASPFAAAWTWRAGQRGWATVASVVSLTSLVWVWFLNTWNILAWAA